MTSQSLTLPYPPTTNNLYRNTGRGRVKTETCKAFHNTVHALALQARIKPVSGEVHLTLHVYRPQKRGDLDNTIKVIQDSLTGLAWGDDEQVVEIRAYRHDDKKNPRAEVTIETVEAGE